MAYDREKERQEAAAAGSRALESLHRAADELDNARGWGIYDMIGGGLISSLFKHSRMDRAREFLEDARRELRQFETELRDVDGFESINLETQDFLGIADVIFDGLLADAMMQSRIKEAQAQVDEAIRRVEEILATL